jgi:tetratricopeptide (TPR) repeat protein
MEGDLATVKRVLARDGSEAVGDYLAAAWWQTAGRPDLARREAEAGLAADPANATIRLLAARLAAQAEDWNACLTHTHALVASPTSDLSEIDLLRAASLAGLGKLDEARTVYRNLIMRQPRALAAYLGLASLHETAGDLPEATTWIEKVHDLYPADLEILRQHIRLLAVQSRVADAEAVGQRALESWMSRRSRSKIEDPRLDADRHESLVFGDVKILQAIAAGFTDAARWQAAKAWADRAVAAAERQPAPIRRTLLAEAQSVLAEMSMRQGRAAAPGSEARRAVVKQATALYREVRSAVPTNLAAANNLALLLALECGEAEPAAALVDEIRRGSQSGRTISGDRMPLEILDTAGLVYRAAGQYDKALTLFREASRRYADEPRIYQHLGACYVALARPQEAASSFASAERLAREQAARTTDRGRKAKLEALAAAVHHELDGLPAAESSRP